MVGSGSLLESVQRQGYETDLELETSAELQVALLIDRRHLAEGCSVGDIASHGL